MPAGALTLSGAEAHPRLPCMLEAMLRMMMLEAMLRMMMLDAMLRKPSTARMLEALKPGSHPQRSAAALWPSRTGLMQGIRGNSGCSPVVRAN